MWKKEIKILCLNKIVHEELLLKLSNNFIIINMLKII